MPRSSFSHSGIVVKAVLLVFTTIFGMGFVGHQVSGVSSNTLVGFFETSKKSSTLLSPANTGTGLGAALQASVQNSSDTNLFNLFLKTPLSFQGRGFNATFSASGFEFLTLELEGPAGLVPNICDKFSVQHNANNGNPGPSFYGCGTPLNATPLAGYGTIVNETIYSGYNGSPSQQIGLNDNVYFSIFFSSSNSQFIGSTILLHYGGATSNSTSYFRINP